jgi:hypothetical protein
VSAAEKLVPAPSARARGSHLSVIAADGPADDRIRDSERDGNARGLGVVTDRELKLVGEANAEVGMWLHDCLRLQPHG